jgi:hypothetical protein
MTTHKPGWKTTEFWLTVAAELALVLTAIQGSLPPKWAAISGTVAGGLYAISRGQAKSAVGAGTSPPR